MAAWEIKPIPHCFSSLYNAIMSVFFFFCFRFRALTPQFSLSYITSPDPTDVATIDLVTTDILSRMLSKACHVFPPTGKSFEITYIRLKFYTSRPESFAIYKRTKVDGPWLPYQYYSASCRKTYGKDPKGYIRPGDDERTASCTDEFSDISPLTGGNVAFSTLEGRPSAYNFDQSLVLQVRPHSVVHVVITVDYSS